MAFTQDQIDALTEAIATGVLTVTHNGKTVTYASTSAMLLLRDRMIREVSGATRRPRLSNGISFRRG